MKLDLEKLKAGRRIPGTPVSIIQITEVELMIQALEEAKEIIELELTKVSCGAAYRYSDKNVWLNKYFGESDG